MICSHYCSCCVNIRYQCQIIVGIIGDEYDLIILLTSKCLFLGMGNTSTQRNIMCSKTCLFISNNIPIFHIMYNKDYKRDSLWPDRKEIWNDSSYFDSEL